MYKEQENGKTVAHLSTVEARSGSRTKITRNILAISLGLVIVLLLVALAFGFLETGQSGADKVTADNTAQTEAN